MRKVLITLASILAVAGIILLNALTFSGRYARMMETSITVTSADDSFIGKKMKEFFAREDLEEKLAHEMESLPLFPDHPEYHEHLRQPERYLEQDWHPEQGQTNPFLHLMMHLSIDEQCSIDQPPGVRALLAALAERHDSRHTAQHEAMDGMAEMLWRAQREGRFPDPNVYLNILRDKLGEAEQFNLQRLDEIQ